ncbi:MAG: glycine dehydrogenase, partial [Spirochaetaceae bacterium]|nr:glycine dehydrogenase [Spirochaetaceae bacterium]
MPYIPITPSQRDAMLGALGLSSLEALFDDLPKPLRFPSLSLEQGVSELEAARELSALAKA